MLKEVIISNRGIKHLLFVVRYEALDALEMFAPLVDGPQSLHWLDLHELCHGFEGELQSKCLIDYLQFPIFGVKFQVFEVFVGRFDEDHEIDLMFVEIFFLNIKSSHEKLLEIPLERFVNFVVLAFSLIVLLVHFLDPLSELAHNRGLDFTCLQFGLLKGVDQFLAPLILLDGLFLGHKFRLSWLS